MNLFTKIILLMLISFIVVIFSISYFITIKQISDVKKNILQKHSIIGNFQSKDIEVGYFESHWPFENLKKLSEYKGFLFWWIVDDKGVIHLANNASFIRTVAKDYFPEVPLMRKQVISLNIDKNYGIFFKQLNTGNKKWSFWYGFSLDEISKRKKEIIFLIASISISVLFVAGVILFFGIKHFIRPINAITRGASIIGRGNLTHRVKIESKDELRDLAQSFNKMADDLQKSYTSLQESEGKYRNLVERANDGVIIVQDGMVKFSNTRLAEMFGFTVEEMINTPFLDYIFPDERFRIKNIYQRRLQGEDVPNIYEMKAFHKDGRKRVIETNSGIITYHGKPATLAFIRDVTERKLAEKALRDSEERFKFLAEKMADIIWTVNRNFQTTYVSPSIQKILGFTPEERKRQTMDEIMTPESIIKVQELFLRELKRDEEEAVDPDRSVKIEVEYYHKDGSIVWMENSVKAIRDTTGAIEGMYGVSRDITERKRTEEQLKASLKEKEILLREIHHRVKNNLAVISSLLSIQANIVTDQGVHSALQESQNRIKAMALIHESLYQSENLALIDLKHYVKDLVRNIINAFDDITGFEIDVQDVKLEVNQAISCGLIVNELATNAVKHAFADEKNCIVRITAGYIDDDKVELKVSDNGRGFPKELNWKKSKSLGLRLISLMVDQLHGTMDIRNNRGYGTEITIIWPVLVA